MKSNNSGNNYRTYKSISLFRAIFADLEETNRVIFTSAKNIWKNVHE